MNAGLFPLSPVKPFNGMAALRGLRRGFPNGNSDDQRTHGPVVIQP